jgi:F0F1-type ATP synthase assembly protein I
MTTPTPPTDGQRPPPQRLAPLKGLAAGYTLLAAVLIGFGLGWLIDHLCGSTPWATVGCSLFFIVAGLYHAVKDQ